MGTWVLILTLMARESVALNSIPGFTSEVNCQQAGQKWAETNGGVGVKTKFLCVPQL
jgi:hypothetical protein